MSLLALILVGLFVSRLIEEAVIHNSGAATALYVDSVVAPLLPDMQKEEVLDDASARALDETLGQGALGSRLFSFKLWSRDGTILYSNQKELTGKTFPVNEKLREAFSGVLVARYDIASDPESALEARLGAPLMEIYNPVLQPWSGQAVAVLEFYETADGLAHSLSQARLQSWLAVAGVILTFFLVLWAIVMRGSRTIENQRQLLNARVGELSDMLAENRALQQRLKRASQQAAALNESHLRSIGADLHDGPVQNIAYASLRLDSDVLVDESTSAETREKELSWIRASLADALTEIRNICSGLVLPQVESASVSEIVDRVARAHRQKTDTEIDVKIDDDGGELAAAVKICIYRFVQEALNNAFRHGGGIGQSVVVSARNAHIKVEVSDRGDGFDTANVRPTSLGLVGLRERIDSLGGSFDIRSGENGTTVTMTFEPMDTEDGK